VGLPATDPPPLLELELLELVVLAVSLELFSLDGLLLLMPR
jgi:hypothetical protein